MKTMIHLLTLSMILWSAETSIWLPKALAADPKLTATNGGEIKSPTSGELTQQQAEKKTKDVNDQGSSQATMMGMAAIAAGAAMIAAGMAQQPPNGALIAAGAALVAAGMAGLAAAQKMAQNADKANDYQNGLINTGPKPIVNNPLKPPTNDSGIKIDPNLLRNGRIDTIMSDMEQKTGMSREDLAKGLENGTPLSKMMADANKKLNNANSMAAIDKALAGADGHMSSSELMDKLGLTAADLGSGDDVYASGGGGSSYKGSGASSAQNFDFGLGKTDPAGSSTISALKVSEDVQNALDKNGITGRTIFEMVHTQYTKKTPQMFGIIQEKTRNPASAAENPFSNLDTGNIEL